MPIHDADLAVAVVEVEVVAALLLLHETPSETSPFASARYHDLLCAILQVSTVNEAYALCCYPLPMVLLLLPAYAFPLLWPELVVASPMRLLLMLSLLCC